jgi:uncharacterized membrane protein
MAAVVLRALTLLGVTGASCSLFLQQLAGGEWLGPFVSQNTMTFANRQRLLIGIVAGAAVGMVLGLLVLWRRGARGLERTAHLLAPVILLGFIPQLCQPSAWTSQVDAAIVIGLLLLLADRLFRMAFAAAAPLATPAPDGYPPWWRLIVPRRLRRWLPPLLVVAGAIAYGLYMSVFTLRMHGRFQTYNFDLGQYDNVFYNLLHGHPLRMSPLGLDTNWSDLRNHADLSVFFFLPIYAIKPGATTLLVMQSFTLGLGAIPIYRFAARRLPRGYAAAIAFAYLMYPPMHGMEFYDFHMQPMASTFCLFVIDFVDQKRYVLCAIAFAVAITCREDISVGLAVLGAFLMLSGHRVVPGLVIAVVSSIYFVLMRFVIMPSFGTWGFADIYKDLFPAGANNFGGVIATLISNPIYTLLSLLTAEKLRYALQILLPLGFLPLRRAYLAVSLAAGSIFTLLTTKYPPTIDIGFQYSAHFFPYVFSAVTLAIASYPPEGLGLVRRRSALCVLALGTALSGVFWGAIPPREQVHGGFSMMTMRAPTEADKQKDRYIKELHAMVPPKASLAIGEAEMTHISHLKVKGLRDSMDTDYVLYSIGSGGDRALVSGEFEKVAERPGGLTLLVRKSPTVLPPLLPRGERRPAAPPPPAANPAPFAPRPPMNLAPPPPPGAPAAPAPPAANPAAGPAGSRVAPEPHPPGR